MKFYITQEDKEKLENEIKKLDEKLISIDRITRPIFYTKLGTQIIIYKKILQSSIVLPVEESWVNVEFSLDNWFDDLVDKYKQGLIIQPKQ